MQKIVPSALHTPVEREGTAGPAVAMLGSFLAATRRSGRDVQQLVATGARAFGSVVPAEGNPFLRYSNPFPVAIDHSPLLATLPDTQVRL